MERVYKFNKLIKWILILSGIFLIIIVFTAPFGIFILYYAFSTKLILKDHELVLKRIITRSARYNQIKKIGPKDSDVYMANYGRGMGAAQGIVRSSYKQGTITNLRIETADKKFNIPINLLENKEEIIKFLKKKKKFTMPKKK